MGKVTLLVERAREGDRDAFDRIVERLHPELRRDWDKPRRLPAHALRA